MSWAWDWLGQVPGVGRLSFLDLQSPRKTWQESRVEILSWASQEFKLQLGRCYPPGCRV